VDVFDRARPCPAHRASSVPRVEVTRIHDGLWRWAVHRDGVALASAYLEHGDAILLVDPVLPAAGDDLDRFRRAIERDIERLGGPVWVLATRDDDPRDAQGLVAITGARAWAPGSPAPAGLESLGTGRPGECALWSPVHRALMPGRALIAEDGVLVGAPGVDAQALLACAPAVVIPSLGPMPA
jgi:hypothetical protein